LLQQEIALNFLLSHLSFISTIFTLFHDIKTYNDFIILCLNSLLLKENLRIKDILSELEKEKIIKYFIIITMFTYSNDHSFIFCIKEENIIYILAFVYNSVEYNIYGVAHLN
ncbi:hypothetical protein ACJX0J_029055, partial [Zea mays]